MLFRSAKKAPASKPEAKPVAKAAPTKSAPAKSAVAEHSPAPKAGKNVAKGKAKGAAAPVEVEELIDVEEPEATAEESSASTEKAKPLRMKISKAKERALMKEFGLDETILSEEDLLKRRQRLKTLIKLGKTRGYLTHGEISDHLPDKLVDAETDRKSTRLNSSHT